MKPFQMKELNNEIRIVSNANSETGKLNVAKNKAILMANAYFELETQLGIDSIFNNNIIILTQSDRLCDRKVVKVDVNNKSEILYGCVGDKDELSWFISDIVKSESYANDLIFIENFNSSINAYYSPNHTFSVLNYGGGIEFIGNKETKEIVAIKLDNGSVKTVPDRSLMFVRTSSKSNTPTVTDIFQFLTNKYFLNLNFIMTKDKSFWKLVYDYKNNRNYIVKIEEGS